MRTVAIAGCSGRMGRTLLENIFSHPNLQLRVALDQPGSLWIGRPVTELIGQPSSVLISDQLSELKNANVLIDFTRPEGTVAHLAECIKTNTQLVIGTTGFTSEQKQIITDAAKKIAIMMAPNMSIGVNVTLKLLEVAARYLNEGFDIEIIEAHHRHKVDAPSGTALKMGEVIAQALGRDLQKCAVYGREGVTGERDAQTIGFATVRGGDIVGDHTVLFAGIGERIEISHKATNRATFAQGALRAAEFLSDKTYGLFNMQDVLGF